MPKKRKHSSSPPSSKWLVGVSLVMLLALGPLTYFEAEVGQFLGASLPANNTTTPVPICGDAKDPPDLPVQETLNMTVTTVRLVAGTTEVIVPSNNSLLTRNFPPQTQFTEVEFFRSSCRRNCTANINFFLGNELKLKKSGNIKNFTSAIDVVADRITVSNTDFKVTLNHEEAQTTTTSFSLPLTRSERSEPKVGQLNQLLPSGLLEMGSDVVEKTVSIPASTGKIKSSFNQVGGNILTTSTFSQNLFACKDANGIGGNGDGICDIRQCTVPFNTPPLPPPEVIHGLTGEYFNNPAPGSTRAYFTDNRMTRIDPNINFPFGNGSPDPLIINDNFSVRWSGQIQLDLAGDYRFFTTNDDQVSLKINGRTIFNGIPPAQIVGVTSFAGSGTFTVPTAEAGRKYDIILEFAEFGGGAFIHFNWDPPGAPTPEIVPTNVLFPTLGSAVASGAQIIGETGQGDGLRGKYFNSAALSGTFPNQIITFSNLFTTRVDPSIDFIFRSNTVPISGMNLNDYGIRWTGALESRSTGSYTFKIDSLQAGGYGRLTLNNQILSNSNSNNQIITLNLEAGRLYPILLEWIKNGPQDNAIRFKWSGPNFSEERIPTSNLFSNVSECSDGRDNDSDGKTDAIGQNKDPDCASSFDNVEATSACSDSVDNDNDGKIDFGAGTNADPGCSGTGDNDEGPSNLPSATTNLLDFNGDGRVEFSDFADFGLLLFKDEPCSACDLSGDGNINPEDVNVFQDRFIDRFDENDDGVIDSEDIDPNDPLLAPFVGSIPQGIQFPEDQIGDIPSGFTVKIGGVDISARRDRSNHRGKKSVQILKGGISRIEFDFDFDGNNGQRRRTPLPAVIRTQADEGISDRGGVVVSGLSLDESRNERKAIFIDRIAGRGNPRTILCIEDAPIDSLSAISARCNEENEFRISCPGQSGPSGDLRYDCSLTADQSQYKVTGLTHSGGVEFEPTGSVAVTFNVASNVASNGQSVTDQDFEYTINPLDGQVLPSGATGTQRGTKTINDLPVGNYELLVATIPTNFTVANSTVTFLIDGSDTAFPVTFDVGFNPPAPAPECSDGNDNDGDGKIDFDGKGGTLPDEKCLNADGTSESPPTKDLTVEYQSSETGINFGQFHHVIKQAGASKGDAQGGGVISDVEFGDYVLTVDPVEGFIVAIDQATFSHPAITPTVTVTPTQCNNGDDDDDDGKKDFGSGDDNENVEDCSGIDDVTEDTPTADLTITYLSGSAGVLDPALFRYVITKDGVATPGQHGVTLRNVLHGTYGFEPAPPPAGFRILNVENSNFTHPGQLPIVKVAFTACNDGLDNDEDGKIDLLDPRCGGDKNGSSELPQEGDLVVNYLPLPQGLDPTLVIDNIEGTSFFGGPTPTSLTHSNFQLPFRNDYKLIVETPPGFTASIDTPTFAISMDPAEVNVTIVADPTPVTPDPTVTTPDPTPVTPDPTPVVTVPPAPGTEFGDDHSAPPLDPDTATTPVVTVPEVPVPVATVPSDFPEVPDGFIGVVFSNINANGRKLRRDQVTITSNSSLITCVDPLTGQSPERGVKCFFPEAVNSSLPVTFVISPNFLPTSDFSQLFGRQTFSLPLSDGQIVDASLSLSLRPERPNFVKRFKTVLSTLEQTLRDTDLSSYIQFIRGVTP